MLAHLPIILLIGPVIILFLGIIADPEETHAVWYGMLNTLGIFELPELTDIERLTYAEKRHYFWFGEVGMAAILAGVFAVPPGIFMAGRTEITLAFIGAAVRFLPCLIRSAMKVDTDAVSENPDGFSSSSNCMRCNSSDLEAFGRNEQARKVFWAVFIAFAGLVLAQVVDPATAQAILSLIISTG